MSIEHEFIDKLVEDYEREGWRVEDSTSAAKQLDFQPDLVLKRGEEVLVVEVKRTGFVSDRAISRMRSKVEEMPNWRFDLKLIPPSREFRAQRPVGKDIIRRIGVAQRLLAEGFASESFILTWTVVEAILRNLVEPSGDNLPEAPVQLICRAYEAEAITDAELRSIQRSYEIRNRLVHGFAVPDVESNAHQLLPIAEVLAKRAEGTDEKR